VTDRQYITAFLADQPNGATLRAIAAGRNRRSIAARLFELVDSGVVVRLGFSYVKGGRKLTRWGLK
jgi:hypothetical protein